MDPNEPPPATDVAACLSVLRRLRADPQLCAADGPLRAVQWEANNLLKAVKKLTGQRLEESRESPPLIPADPDGPACYVCKQPVSGPHPSYPSLCPGCGELSLVKRHASADLRGRVAMVTGARVGIGYRTALKLLRAGAVVLATTRFPRTAGRRFLGEPDQAVWQGRLHLFGTDFRDLRGVERLAGEVRDRFERLDILINNAAQTVRRPAAFYQALLAGERDPPPLLPGASAPPTFPLVPVAAGEPLADPANFPPGCYDAEGQPLDLRPANSWTVELDGVSTVELAECHAVNSIAPFILVRELEPLMLRSPAPDRYVVNVTAREGQFRGGTRQAYHPHTNMAKAALNMFTRTAAGPLAGRGIFMTGVDPGFVSEQLPEAVVRRERDAGTYRPPPLDPVDGAARVLDPVFTGLTGGERWSGVLLKHFRPVDW